MTSVQPPKSQTQQSPIEGILKNTPPQSKPIMRRQQSVIDNFRHVPQTNQRPPQNFYNYNDDFHHNHNHNHPHFYPHPHPYQQPFHGNQHHLNHQEQQYRRYERPHEHHYNPPYGYAQDKYLRPNNRGPEFYQPDHQQQILRDRENYNPLQHHSSLAHYRPKQNNHYPYNEQLYINRPPNTHHDDQMPPYVNIDSAYDHHITPHQPHNPHHHIHPYKKDIENYEQEGFMRYQNKYEQQQNRGRYQSEFGYHQGRPNTAYRQQEINYYDRQRYNYSRGGVQGRPDNRLINEAMDQNYDQVRLYQEKNKINDHDQWNREIVDRFRIDNRLPYNKNQEIRMKSPQRNIDTVKSIYLSPNYKLHNEELRRRSISPQHPYRNEENIHQAKKNYQRYGLMEQPQRIYEGNYNRGHDQIRRD